MSYKILMLGDVYGKPGREVLKEKLETIVKDNNIDFVIVNGENATHGKGINQEHFNFFKSLNIDVVTSGNHIFKQPETINFINDEKTLLRPLNLNSSIPGNGYVIVEKNNKKVCVLNLMGRSFMDRCDNPYDVMDEFLSLKLSYDILVIDFHAEATAEKIAFAWNYDGIVTTFAGTHTHVQTADERLLPKGTAFITDLGMTGVIDSIIGAEPKQVIIKEKTDLPVKFETAKGTAHIKGIIIEIDEKSNKAVNIKRI